MAAEFFQVRLSDARRERDSVIQIHPKGLRSLRASVSVPNIDTISTAQAAASASGSRPPRRQAEDSAVERQQGLYSGGQERSKNDEMRRSLAELRASRTEAGSSARPNSASFGARTDVSRSVPSLRKPAVLEAPAAAPRLLRPSGPRSQMVPARSLPPIADGSQSAPGMRPPSQGSSSPEFAAGSSPPGFRPGRRLRSKSVEGAAVSPSTVLAPEFQSASFFGLGHSEPTASTGGAPRADPYPEFIPDPYPQFIPEGEQQQQVPRYAQSTVHVLQPSSSSPSMLRASPSSSPGMLRVSPGANPSPGRLRRAGEAPLNGAPVFPAPPRQQSPSWVRREEGIQAQGGTHPSAAHAVPSTLGGDPATGTSGSNGRSGDAWVAPDAQSALAQIMDKFADSPKPPRRPPVQVNCAPTALGSSI